MSDSIEKRTVFSDYDSFLFHQGTNYEVYKKLGAHQGEAEGVQGTWFNVWAPNARYVSVITAKTGWENEQWMHRAAGDPGVWECFLADVGQGDAYRYVITGEDGVKRYKSDPYGFWFEKRPDNASIVWGLDNYEWHDEIHQSTRDNTRVLERPMSIYEVYLGSWKKGFQGDWDEDGFLNYTQYADDLAQYLTYMGFTHVELMGVCEHPFDLSWGYQVTGFYAPTSRYGTPDDFRYFVDRMHQAGIGVILDWVPAHFPKDAFAMGWFDGTPLYENSDPLRREFPVWGTLSFDHGKPEVRSFLIANAMYWIREFHIDALRVDAVASMLYNDYDRSEWRPNVFGGRMNLESMDFLRQLNYEVCGQTTGFLIAEDSSAEWGVTEDVKHGGLGFTFKWNMGWMNDTIRYMNLDPVYRKWHHDKLTHIADYAFSENYVLVLSHDEVVYGKGTMVKKAPGSQQDRMGTLKAMYTWQFTFPGKKLLFMGQEFAMDNEWNVKQSIDWHLADDFAHRDIMQCVQNLLNVYKTRPCLYMDSKNPTTFEWVNRGDADRNILAYYRRNPWNYDGAVLVVINFSPMEYHDYTVGVPFGGFYNRVFSTYDSLPGQGNPAEIGGIPPLTAQWHDCDGYSHMLTYSLRPFEAIIVDFPTQDA